jgi:hypothetical protein
MQRRVVFVYCWEAPHRFVEAVVTGLVVDQRRYTVKTVLA